MASPTKTIIAGRQLRQAGRSRIDEGPGGGNQGAGLTGQNSPLREIIPKKIRLKDYAAAGYPDLHRAMVATVHRPWSTAWRGPSDAFWATMAWRIRHYESLILDIPESECTESHAMIYAGGGWCLSQDAKFGAAHLRDYKGCRVTFWDYPPDGLACPGRRERNDLVAESVVHFGRPYGVRDISALRTYAKTGDPAVLLEQADQQRWICSEAACRLVRRWTWPEFGGSADCLVMVPHALALWMAAQGWPCVALEIG